MRHRYGTTATAKSGLIRELVNDRMNEKDFEFAIISHSLILAFNHLKNARDLA